MSRHSRARTPLPKRALATARRPGVFVPALASAGLIVSLSGSAGAASAVSQPGTTAVSAAVSAEALAAALAGRTAQGAAATTASTAAELASAESREKAEIRAQRAAAERKAIAERKAAAAAKEKKEREARAKRQRWVSPLKSPQLTSNFGTRWGRLHAGLDFGAVIGTELRSLSTGVVTLAEYSGGYGNKIEITYWDGTVSYYAHLSEIAVEVGQEVKPGEYVGKTGNTGNSTGPHLHLEIHPEGGDPIDPKAWFAERRIKF